ncbi:MAG: cupin domain-containing protein [Candidatus Dadabacteria bacterium]|nr:cupin domain-containing protein [Candidatus Dadabacteria bacterium]NIQ14020.1 cupin domain-containing protein [Candidatus Dadabacteria bacterium]
MNNAYLPNFIVLTFIILFISCSYPKPTNREIIVTKILDTNTSWDGKSFYYPQGTPQVSSYIVEIDSGKTLDFHCHPVPTFAYILEGTVEVETSDGLTKTFKSGDAFVEVMNTWHKGKAIEAPLKILVFYASAENIPISIKANNNFLDKKCFLENK